LPFNKNKWSIIFQPTYQYYQKEKLREWYIFEYHDKVKYQSIELPLGVRYKMFLSDYSKLYVDFSIVFWDFPINSKINELEIGSGINMVGGIGYSYKNYGIEVTYSNARNLLDMYHTYNAPYESISLMVYYSLFNK